MKTHSALTRLCLASLPAFALTLSAAEAERRENADRQPEPQERREGRREARPEQTAVPRDGERAEPRDQQRAQSAGARRPGAETGQPQAGRPDEPAIRDGERRGPNPEANRSGSVARREGGTRPSSAGPREGGNPEERQKHIREAIEHLRLAGLHDVAEHLQQNLTGANRPHEPGQAPQANHERMGAPGGNHPNLQPPGGAGPQGRNFTPPMAGGSPNELRELHEQVAQLKKMVEELARQRR